MSDLDDPLRTLFHDLAGQAPHDPDLATTVRRRSRRRRAAVTIPLAAASVVAVVAAVTVGVLSAGRSGSQRPSRITRRVMESIHCWAWGESSGGSSGFWP